MLDIEVPPKQQQYKMLSKQDYRQLYEAIQEWQELTSNEIAAERFLECLAPHWNGVLDLKACSLESFPENFFEILKDRFLEINLEENEELEDIPGIENCEVLHTLKISKTKIKIFDVGPLSSLKNFHATNLSNFVLMGLEKCHDLEVLDLSYCDFTELDLTHNENIKELNLEANTLLPKIIGLEKLSKLQILNIGFSSFTYLDISPFQELIILDTKNNFQLEQIVGFNACQKLKEITISFNSYLEEIDIRENKNIHTIIADNTRTRIIGLEEQSELRVLDMPNSLYSHIPLNVTKMSNLIVFLIRHANAEDNIKVFLEDFGYTEDGALIAAEGKGAILNPRELEFMSELLYVQYNVDAAHLYTLRQMLIDGPVNEETYESLFEQASSLSKEASSSSEETPAPSEETPAPSEETPAPSKEIKLIESKTQANRLLRAFAQMTLFELEPEQAQKLVESVIGMVRLVDDNLPLVHSILSKAIVDCPHDFQRRIEVPKVLCQIWHKGNNERDVAIENFVKTARAIAIHSGESETHYEVKASVIFTDNVKSISALLEDLRIRRNHFIQMVNEKKVTPRQKFPEQYYLEKYLKQNSDQNFTQLPLEVVDAYYGNLLAVLKKLNVEPEDFKDTLDQLDKINIVDRRTLYDPTSPHWEGLPEGLIKELDSAVTRQLYRPYYNPTAASDIERLEMMGLYPDMDMICLKRFPKLYAFFGVVFHSDNGFMGFSRHQPKSENFRAKHLEQITDDYRLTNDIDASFLTQQIHPPLFGTALDEREEKVKQTLEDHKKGLVSTVFDPTSDTKNSLPDLTDSVMRIISERRVRFPHDTDLHKNLRSAKILIVADLSARRPGRGIGMRRIATAWSIEWHVKSMWSDKILKSDRRYHPIYQLQPLVKRDYVNFPARLEWNNPPLLSRGFSNPELRARELAIQRRMPLEMKASYSLSVLFQQLRALQSLEMLQSQPNNAARLSKLQNSIEQRINNLIDLLPAIGEPLKKLPEVNSLRVAVEQEIKSRSDRMQELIYLRRQESLAILSHQLRDLQRLPTLQSRRTGNDKLSVLQTTIEQDINDLKNIPLPTGPRPQLEEVDHLRVAIKKEEDGRTDRMWQVTELRAHESLSILSQQLNALQGLEILQSKRNGSDQLSILQTNIETRINDINNLISESNPLPITEKTVQLKIEINNEREDFDNREYQTRVLYGHESLLVLEKQLKILQGLDLLQSRRNGKDELSVLQTYIEEKISTLKNKLPSMGQPLEAVDVGVLKIETADEIATRPTRIQRIKRLEEREKFLEAVEHLKLAREELSSVSNKLDLIKQKMSFNKLSAYMPNNPTITHYETILNARAKAHHIPMKQLLDDLDSGTPLTKVSVDDKFLKPEIELKEKTETNTTSPENIDESKFTLDELNAQLDKTHKLIDDVRNQCKQLEKKRDDFEQKTLDQYRKILELRATENEISIDNLLQRLQNGDEITETLTKKHERHIEEFNNCIEDYNLPMPSKLRFASPFRKQGIHSPIKIGASSMERALRKEFTTAIPPFKKLGDITEMIELSITPIFQNAEFTLAFPKNHEPNIVLVITAQDKLTRKVRITDDQFSKAINKFMRSTDDDSKPKLTLRLFPAPELAITPASRSKVRSK